jgi:CENP-B N-terminal DNA-binding domain
MDDMMDDLPLLKKTRVYLTAKKKIEICDRVLLARNTNKGESLRAVARDEKVSPKQIREWLKNLTKLKALGFRRQLNVTLHVGAKTSFKYPDQLVTWVLELRKEGMPVSLGMAILKASIMDNDFRRKIPMTRYSIMRRLLRSHGITIRAKTHESQRDPKEVVEEAKAFVKNVQPSVNQTNRDKRFIMNMDQTPVFSP